MGRRPNQIVVEFFERGEKLEDTSNRYQHTCKRCGQFFPKGRVDSLTAHLLRSCPRIARDERQYVFQQVQQNPGKSQQTGGSQLETDQDNLQLEIPVPNYQQQSALDTLAEVSRHHLDYSTHRPPNDAGLDLEIPSLAEQHFIAQLQEFNTPSDPPPANETYAPVIEESNSTAEPSTQTDNLQLAPTASTASLIASGLIQTASAANQALESNQTNHIPQQDYGAFVDPSLHSMGGPVQVQSLLQTAGRTAYDPWVSTTNMQIYDTAAPRPTFGFGPSQRHTPKKIRGRFDDSRRKEVAGVRKTGACIRCRMLKKSCSGEVPCRTCRSVDVARLWKGTCFRARVVEEFTLWSSRLFHSLSIIETSAAVHGLEQVQLPRRVEVSMHPRSEFCMSFAARTHRHDFDPSQARSDRIDTEEVILLNGQTDLSDKSWVDAYTNLLIETFINDEASLFTRTTLHFALSVAKEEDANQEAKADKTQEHSPSSRTCYNLQERLIHNTVQLWLLTKLLTTAEDRSFQMQYRDDVTLSQQPELVQWSTGAEAGVQHLPPTSQSHRLITRQLLAAIEDRCSRLSKVVMNELERRLLQRQQANQFATYISSVLLLSCVERMTGFYRSFDVNEVSTSHDHNDDTSGGATHDEIAQQHLEEATGNEFSNTVANPHNWPLDTPASALWPQGPRFADLLTMLLRMRALPPKTSQTPEGTLAVIRSFPLPSAPHNRSRSEPNEQTEAAAAWLDPMHLSIDELAKRRDGDLPTRDEGLEAWDMILISKILLPEQTT